MELFSTIIPSSAATAPAHSEEADVDAKLVERVRAGDMGAFDAIVHKYRARVYSVIYNLTSNNEDASDLTQEAFIRAFRSLNKFQGRSAFFTWLYQIAINITLSALRRQRLRRFFSFDTLEETSESREIVEHLSARSDSDRAAFLKELQEKLNEALQKLSPKHRAVVVMAEIEGLSHREIAQVLDCSEGTVRSRLHYAKNQLQSYLQSYVE